MHVLAGRMRAFGRMKRIAWSDASRGDLVGVEQQRRDRIAAASALVHCSPRPLDG
jgi:hypothetical protein